MVNSVSLNQSKTIFKLKFWSTTFDWTDFISKMQQNAPFSVLLKKKDPSPLPLLVSRGLACMYCRRAGGSLSKLSVHNFIMLIFICITIYICKYSFDVIFCTWLKFDEIFNLFTDFFFFIIFFFLTIYKCLYFIMHRYSWKRIMNSRLKNNHLLT